MDCGANCLLWIARAEREKERDDSDDLFRKLDESLGDMCWFMVTCITVKGLKCVENVSEANGMYIVRVIC